jgi:small subunit ribosomal protein S3
MIEKKFVNDKIKEFLIAEFIGKQLRNVGYSDTKIKKTPLGEKIIINASKPGFVVGRKGENIKRISENLKELFELDNPQVEINEISNPNRDPRIIGERIAVTLERFGVNRFKSVGHRALDDVMNAGALGVEILISGRVPSSRAKRWRFYQGYLKKSGDIALTDVKKAKVYAFLKSGVIGIQVRIMPSDIQLPDKIEFIDELQTEESSEDISEEEVEAIEKDAGESKESKEETAVDEETKDEEVAKTAVDSSEEKQTSNQQEKEKGPKKATKKTTKKTTRKKSAKK